MITQEGENNTPLKRCVSWPTCGYFYKCVCAAQMFQGHRETVPGVIHSVGGGGHSPGCGSLKNTQMLTGHLLGAGNGAGL